MSKVELYGFLQKNMHCKPEANFQIAENESGSIRMASVVVVQGISSLSVAERGFRSNEFTWFLFGRIEVSA